MELLAKKVESRLKENAVTVEEFSHVFWVLGLCALVYFHGRPGLVLRVAQRLDRAIGTLRLSSYT
jgi:hypothetical protein